MPDLRLDDLGLIRFVSIPKGDAPDWVRSAWIGVEVTCLFSHDGIPFDKGGVYNVVSGLEIPEYPGYIVFQTHALEALRKKSPEAARYWSKLGFPLYDSALFLFSLESAEVVKPVLTREELWKRFGNA